MSDELKFQRRASEEVEPDIQERPTTSVPFVPGLNLCFVEAGPIKISLQSAEPITLLRKHAEDMLEKIILKPGVAGYVG